MPCGIKWIDGNNWTDWPSRGGLLKDKTIYTLERWHFVMPIKIQFKNYSKKSNLFYILNSLNYISIFFFLVNPFILGSFLFLG